MIGVIPDRKRIPITALFIGTIAGAFAPIFIRYCDASSVGIAFWRFALAVPVFALIGYYNKPQSQSKISPTGQHFAALIFSGVIFGLGAIIWNVSLLKTNVANAMLLSNCSPIFVALLSWILFKRGIGFRTFLGMVIAILGGSLLVWPHLHGAQPSLWGDGWALLCAVFYAIYLLAIQFARQSFHTVTLMAASGVVSAVTIAVSALFLGESLQVNSGSTWLMLLGLAFIVQVIGLGLTTYALAFVSATLSSIITLFQPVIATLIAWQLFDEKVVLIQAIGMVIVMTGILCVKEEDPV